MAPKPAANRDLDPAWNDIAICTSGPGGDADVVCGLIGVLFAHPTPTRLSREPVFNLGWYHASALPIHEQCGKERPKDNDRKHNN
jgi:hypothetical protein